MERSLNPCSAYLLDERSCFLRGLIIEALDGARRGHIGPSLSLVEILRVLYDKYLHYDPKNPTWEERDRCILSKGHGCLALYALLADKGFFSKKELRKFCHHTSFLGGHPEKGKIPGIEASTGALGHGLSLAVGMALAAKIKKKMFRTVVIMGDGELNEGSIWEAALACAKHKLSNLTVFIDYNKLQCYGSVQEVLPLEPLADKWKSFGFEVAEVDGHDINALESVISSLPLNSQRPTVIICHTIKGKGFSFAENNPTWHYKHVITDEDIENMRSCLHTFSPPVLRASNNA
jgi:transketolase